MEIHIRNVPVQATEAALTNFLTPNIVKFSTRPFLCRKTQNKTFASLTFLSEADGQRFLDLHGQQRNTTSPRTSPSKSLIFLNKPIYCDKSNRPPAKYALKTLEKQEKDRKARTADGPSLDSQAKTKTRLSKVPIKFDYSSVCCGVWAYEGADLVFESHLELRGEGVKCGTATFGERSMIMQFDSHERIDIIYSSAIGITIDEGANPSLTFTLAEAPKFFKRIPETLAETMARFGIAPRQQTWVSPVNRDRTPCLDKPGHDVMAGSCLVYRFNLMVGPAVASSGTFLSEDLQAMEKLRGVPPVTYLQTTACEPEQTYALAFQKLQDVLSSSDGPPVKLAFQMQKLAQNGYLSPAVVSELLPEVIKMTHRSSLAVCVSAVRKLFFQIPFAGPDTDARDLTLEALTNLLYDNEERSEREALNLAGSPGNIAIIHKARVTPAGIYLSGPEPESNNRVLRKYSNYHDYFLRVQFSDEDGEPVRFNPRISNSRIYDDRFKRILQDGLIIAGREYCFLGFSHSSLRAQSCWFVAPFIHEGSLLYDRMIIHDLGDFSQFRSPAKCAARIGQAFSDTPTAISLSPEVLTIAPDVKRNGRVFSDGVGTMSKSVMHMTWGPRSKAMRQESTCCQIRCGGAKGVLSLDTRLKGDVVVLRPSMIKFEGSKSTDLELCGMASKPLPMYLNRQLIKILEDMGVDNNFFLNLQEKEVMRIQSITNSPTNAVAFLKKQSIGDVVHLPWLINRLETLNLDFRADFFLNNVLNMATLMEIRLLKHKSRIPVEKGFHLLGVMDETGTLKEDEVFCTVTVSGRKKIIRGKNLIVSRAPALHPGDVQVAEGVMVPLGSPLLALSNCICFSQQGSRDLPSKLSGGDLDGDRYYVMWDTAGRPKKIFSPADYPRQDPIDIGRAVTKSDMTDFFVEFMKTDQLGRIAVCHRILADQSKDGTLDDGCITLAGMHSTAVDFSKTGVAVDMSKMPKYDGRNRPDFEAPGPHVTIKKKDILSLEDDPDPNAAPVDNDDDFSTYRYYESDKILGKLYRAIDERKIFNEIQQRRFFPSANLGTATVIDDLWSYVKRKCVLIQWEHLKPWARELKDTYEECLLNIMSEYSSHPLRPLSELEAFIGNILGKSGAQTRKQRDLSVSLKQKFDLDAAFIINCILKKESLDYDDYDDFSSGVPSGGGHPTNYSPEALERSMACLAISLEDRAAAAGESKRTRGELLSFKYVAAAVCLREVDRLPG